MNYNPLREMFLSELRNTIKTPNIHGYHPHQLQENFHKSTRRARLFFGGNRAGKTVGGACESIWWLLGNHPYQRTPDPPVRGRGSAVDIEKGINSIMLPELRRWLPPSALINGSWEDSYSKQARLLTLSNGSTMDFMTYEMSTDKHAGTSRHFTWFDEEPPKHIFDEDLLRLVDVDGHWWMTMTPVNGMTWVYYSYYQPIVEEGKPDPNVDVFLIATTQNPYISEEALDEITKGLSEEERQARRFGKFMAASGLVYPEFREDVHVLPDFDMAQLHSISTDKIVSGMDHGLRNPTCWLWAMVDSEGRIIVFAEYYQAERTIEEHSQHVLSFERMHGFSPYYRIGDPAIAQRSAINGSSIQGEYAENGVYVGLGNNDVHYGLNRVRQMFQGSGLFITKNCPMLIRELRAYRWDTWANKRSEETKEKKDQPKKVNDHAVDTLRYIVCSRPETEFAGAAGNLYFPLANSRTVDPETPVTEHSFDLPSNSQHYHAILGEDW